MQCAAEPRFHFLQANIAFVDNVSHPCVSSASKASTGVCTVADESGAQHKYTSFTMTGHLTLPNELLLDIAILVEFRDLRSLVLTNRRLHALLLRRLYRCIPRRYLYSIIASENLSAFKRILEHGLDLGARERYDGFPYRTLLGLVADMWSSGGLVMAAMLLQAGLVDTTQWSLCYRGCNMMPKLLECYGVMVETDVHKSRAGRRWRRSWGWIEYSGKPEVNVVW
jgi:hypothetical protein